MDAARTAIRMATRLGIDVDDLLPLRSTNNVVFRLLPSPVVVKMSDRPSNLLEWELTVGAALFAEGAPVMGPSERVEPVVHRLDGWDMTFWNYCPSGDDAPSPRAIANALAQFHSVLDQVIDRYSLTPTSWKNIPIAVAANLRDDSYASGLRPADRALLLEALAMIFEVEPSSASVGGLHGSPHGFNVVTANGEPKLIDFETVCTGPREWDLSHLDPLAVESFPAPCDPDGLKAARVVVSAMTSALCWESIDRGEDMRVHAEHHLAVVKEAINH